MKNKNLNILISGYYGFANFGDESILDILSSKLKQSGHNVTVLSVSPINTSQLYGINAINSFDIKSIILAVLKNDILISGGGSLLQDVTSIKSLIYYLCIINAALFFNKKTIIFAQGIGPINNKFAAFLAKLTLKRCSYISVRDRKSKLLLKKWGIEADLVCDPIFDIQLPKYTPKGIVGIQLRKFKMMNHNYIKKLAEFVNKKFSDKKIEIYPFQNSLDSDICAMFENYLKEINPNINTEIISNESPKEIIKSFSHLEYLIAMRFHAVLIAIKYGIKTLALSYDIKVEKLAEESGIPFLRLKSDDDFEQGFNKMISIDTKLLTEYSGKNKFNWDIFESKIN